MFAIGTVDSFRSADAPAGSGFGTASTEGADVGLTMAPSLPGPICGSYPGLAGSP